MRRSFKGRVWRLGDDIDTDTLAPFSTLTEAWPAARQAMLPDYRAFVDGVRPGDIVVAGRNFGCGSSRQQAAENLKALGLAAIIAESFGRIFFRNCIALGFPALECPGALEQFCDGDVVEIDLGAGTVSAAGSGRRLNGTPYTEDMSAIIEAGGVLEKIVADEARAAPAPAPAPSPETAESSRPMTMAEKVLARTSGRASVRPGDYVTCEVDRVVIHEPLVLCLMKLAEYGLERIWDPDKVSVVLCQFFPAPSVKFALGHTLARDYVRKHAIERFFEHQGIINQLMIEKGQTLPGQLVFGTDSHSTSYGAVGAAGAGLGFTEIAGVLATGKTWLRTPSTVRFEMNGAMQDGVMSKDILLYIAGRFGVEVAQYKAIEFGGEAVRDMSIASRITMANMGVELGAKFAFFDADARTLAYLDGRADRPVQPFAADPGAEYEAVHSIELTGVTPQIACPNNPGNVKPVGDVAGVKLDQVFLGSCTNARLEDLAAAAHIIEGRRVHSGVRMIVTPASQTIYQEAMRRGYLQTFADAGAYVTPPGCGACPGGHGGVVGPGEKVLSSTNRNFRGRMGSPDAEIYLGSPRSVAAAAIAGAIVDPREFAPANGEEPVHAFD